MEYIKIRKFQNYDKLRIVEFKFSNIDRSPDYNKIKRVI